MTAKHTEKESSLSHGLSFRYADAEPPEADCDLVCSHSFSDRGTQLLDKAVNLLNYRAHSRKELADKLKRKTGCEDEKLDAVLDRLEDLGFLNDRNYASSVVRSCARKGYGLRRADAELIRRGISKELREEVLNEMPASDNILNRLVRMKLRDPDDRDEIRKVSAAMVRRGYSWDEVRRAIERVSKESDSAD